MTEPAPVPLVEPPPWWAVIDPAPGMVFVQLLVGMSQHDLGTFRLVPAAVMPGREGVAGDLVEVDPETAERWLAAGAAQSAPSGPPA